MRSPRMRSALVLVAIASAHCGGRDTTTAPTPVVNSPTPPVAVTPPSPPPVITTPAPPPVRSPLLDDPRFDLAFYRQFALNGYESPSRLEPLRRHTQAPFIYLMTVDDGGAAIDAGTLDAIASALESVAGQLTGVFGLAGIERGTGPPPTRAGVIAVRWSTLTDQNACGRASVGGNLITLYPKTAGCRCPGGPLVSQATVKHELGHALGFWHTDSREDLMYRTFSGCNVNPSAREIFHARVAYSQPPGSRDPS